MHRWGYVASSCIEESLWSHGWPPLVFDQTVGPRVPPGAQQLGDLSGPRAVGPTAWLSIVGRVDCGHDPLQATAPAPHAAGRGCSTPQPSPDRPACRCAALTLAVPSAPSPTASCLAGQICAAAQRADGLTVCTVAGRPNPSVQVNVTLMTDPPAPHVTSVLLSACWHRGSAPMTSTGETASAANARGVWDKAALRGDGGPHRNGRGLARSRTRE